MDVRNNTVSHGVDQRGMMSELQETIRSVQQDRCQHNVRCPAHDDQHASLSVASGDNGRVLFYCHASCGHEALLAASDNDRSEINPLQPKRS